MRPRQLVVWALLALLVLGMVVIETTDLLQPRVALDRHGHAVQEATGLLPVQLAELQAIEIAHNGELHRFERDHDGAWLYRDHHHEGENDRHDDARHTHEQGHSHDTGSDTHHHADAAEAEHIKTAFSALGRAKIERYLERAQNPAEYGVTRPDMLINVYGENTLRPLARYAVGDIAPDTVSRYIMVVGSFAIVTIPNYQIENLLSLIKTIAEAGPGRD